MKDINLIRKKEAEYHNKLYNSVELFSAGNWLQKPVKTVMDSFEHVEKKTNLVVLDLGCGIGRNTIPLAQELKSLNGRVIGVDILDSAINQLAKYSVKYEIEEIVTGVVSSLENYDIKKSTYDYVVAVSVLEHIESVEALKQVLKVLIEETNSKGVHCFILNTSVREYEKDTMNGITPQFEINLSTDEMTNLLKELYSGWTQLKLDVKSQSYLIDRVGKEVILETEVLTYVVKKS